MVRKVGLALGLLAAVLIAAVFAYNNPDQVAIDIGVTRIENVPVTVAFIVCLAIGWLFGMASAGLAMLRMSRERNRLRRELRLAETEVKGLRGLPLQDAD